MGSHLHRFQWDYVLPLLLVMVSCTLNSAVKQGQNEKDYFRETVRLEKIAREDSEASVRAKSHRQLAFLYLDHRNPQLNYSRALQEMESYLSVMPADTQTDDFQNWFTALQEIKRLHDNMEKVQQTNRSLRSEVASLREMNRGMTQTIERLKRLDLQMEEKRSLTK